MSGGSRVVYDFVYRSVLRGENLFYGEEGIDRRVNKCGEAWKSGIERNEIQSHFTGIGFSALEIADAAFLEMGFSKATNDI